ncbi:hypothetical protein FK529_17540 [Tsukamurella asaccharolytica]|uniref:Uncharacterized protein n=1 Tax=Tsukamurella asaccharolytica TaxID=2592067 RepID=A0A5C5R4R3_9ACTN|nr:hypothetical protein [Tsukamurella asaccharolytica]TWS18009.1 hypothetical protein FK529_17540 [Tsukamurella asaccharolytica]
MTTVASVLSGPPRARHLVGALLTLSALVHVARIGSLPPAAAAASAGLAVVYPILALAVILGERWAYLGAAIVPLIGQLLGDYQAFMYYSNPIDAMDPVVDLLVVPVAIFVLWRTATGARRRRESEPSRD